MLLLQEFLLTLFVILLLVGPLTVSAASTHFHLGWCVPQWCLPELVKVDLKCKTQLLYG